MKPVIPASSVRSTPSGVVLDDVELARAAPLLDGRRCKLAALTLPGARGAELDALAAERTYGLVTRFGASPSVVPVRLSRAPGGPLPAGTVSAGTLLLVGVVQFAFDADVTFLVGQLGPLETTATATSAGAATSVKAGAITVGARNQRPQAAVLLSSERSEAGRGGRMSADSLEECVFLRFEDDDSDMSVVIEDDGRVAYAYLLDGEDMIGDVWLYNVSETPKSVDWRDRESMPFLNPREFCSSDRMPRLSDASDLQCAWLDDGVQVLLDEQIVAVLAPGAKPGWSRYVVRPGPLARPIEELAEDEGA